MCGYAPANKAHSRCINDAGVQPNNGSKGMSNSLTIAAIWVGLPFFHGDEGAYEPGRALLVRARARSSLCFLIVFCRALWSLFEPRRVPKIIKVNLL